MPLPDSETRLDESALPALHASGWKREGESISKTFRRAGWKEAIAFVNAIAGAADELGHHPDIHVERYRNVHVITTTHATGKLSDADVALARRIDVLAAGMARGT
jgi:4a-hydroxytetrahydrobiopterin dehydratase